RIHHDRVGRTLRRSAGNVCLSRREAPPSRGPSSGPSQRRSIACSLFGRGGPHLRRVSGRGDSVTAIAAIVLVGVALVIISRPLLTRSTGTRTRAGSGLAEIVERHRNALADI